MRNNIFRRCVRAVLVAGMGVAGLASAETPLGAEFRVNSYTAGDQQYPVVARSAGGNFVVVWDSVGQDGSLDGIYGQLYDASGAPLAAEFRINEHTDNQQTLPAVAMNAAGEFAVVWQSNSQGTVGIGVYGRRYGANGQPLGAEFKINTSGRDVFAQVGVAIDGAGNTVFVWPERETLALPYTKIKSSLAKLAVIEARLYVADGSARGAPIEVSSNLSDTLRLPVVAMAPDGRYVVAWTAIARGSTLSGPGALGVGIHAQRFAADGSAQGSALDINSYDAQRIVDQPALAMAADGSFVLAWETLARDYSPTGIYARRYAADGTALVTPFRAGGSAFLHKPAVAIGGTGSFVVAAHGDGVHAQRYGANGAALGTDFQVNGHPGHNRVLNAGVGADGGGNFVVTWQSFLQDGDGRGIYARRYAGP